MGRTGKYTALDHLDARNRNGIIEREKYEAAIAFFDHLSIDITEIAWFFNRWRVRLSGDNTDATILPAEYAG